MKRVFLVAVSCCAALDNFASDEALSLLQISANPAVKSAVVAHDKVTLGEEKGNNPQRRATPDGASNIEFVDIGKGGFDSDGKLDKVRFYVQRAGNKGLRFRIYRPSGGGYQFVAQTEEIPVPAANVIQEYSFTEKVPFLAGDYIGWSHTGNGNIPFDGSGTNVFWNYGIQNSGCSAVPNEGTQPRTYSYMISTVPASGADYAAGELCGADVPEGLDDADEAAAEADPHLSGTGGARSDLCCDQGICKPCGAELDAVGRPRRMGMGMMGMMGMGKMGMMGMGKMGMMGMMGMGMGQNDEAAAVGDPHITTNTGKQFDYTSQ